MGARKVSNSKRDLQGHSRALGMVPFDRPLNDFAINVTSCTISEILSLISQNLKRSRDLNTSVSAVIWWFIHKYIQEHLHPVMIVFIHHNYYVRMRSDLPFLSYIQCLKYFGGLLLTTYPFPLSLPQSTTPLRPELGGWAKSWGWVPATPLNKPCVHCARVTFSGYGVLTIYFSDATLASYLNTENYNF